MSNWLVSFFMFLLVLFLNLSFSDALKLNPSDKGVCTVKISTPRVRWRTITYYTNKWCGKTKCKGQKKKKENYKVTVNQTVCCEGWQYKADENICTPLCTAGCIGGRCIDRDVCQCDQHMYLNTQNNTCMASVCDPPCYNAECKLGKCECFDNHSYYNSTHCKPDCEVGYEINTNLNCTPKCEKNCTNGQCVKPNKCECYEGYVMSEDGVCVFNCEPKCENSTCIGVNTCKCDQGFVMTDKSYKCEPKPEPWLTPNICDEGYDNVDGECRPICKNSCVNGNCVARDICQCHKGYTFEENSLYSCIKTCPKVCEGRCDENGKCFNSSSCTGIENCSNDWDCWEYNVTTGACDPICKNGCNNGTCEKPNQCTCKPPYVLRVDYLNNTCILCEKGCFNARCAGDNICVCDENTKRINSTHCAPNCPDGYENSNVTLQCKPSCEVPCINGACIRTNTCQCSEGYTETENSTICVPECKPACENSTCKDGNVCECFEGFEPTGDRWKCQRSISECTSCKCSNRTSCFCEDGSPCDAKAEAETLSPNIARLGITWAVGGAIGVLLLIAVIVLIIKSKKNSKTKESKISKNEQVPFGSVVYTAPGTLLRFDSAIDDDSAMQTAEEGQATFAQNDNDK